MKFVSQVGLAILATVVLVVGVTYISQFQLGGRVDESTPKPDTSSKNSAELTFSAKIVEWDPPAAGEVEQQAKGYHDYWFRNEDTVPFDLGLQGKSCKCSDVSVCLLGAAEADRYLLSARASAASEIAWAHTGMLPLLCQFQVERPVASPQAETKTLTWHKLEQSYTHGVRVDPGIAGMVRVSYEGKKDKVGPERLTVDLWMQARLTHPSPRSYAHLELPVTYVPALRVTDETVSLDDLNPREEKTVQFLCWSSTRADLTSFQVVEQSKDPHFHCSWTPLTDQERKELAERSRSRVLGGYRVRIVTKERLSDMQPMDLGPFSRKVILTADPDIEQTAVSLMGVVRGEVTVGAEQDKGKIALGTFPASRGISKSVKITSEQPGLELKLDRVEPEGIRYVKASEPLKPKGSESAARWELTVEVSAGCPSGKLPEHCTVILKIPGETPRYVRIPVTGMAYQRSGE